MTSTSLALASWLALSTITLNAQSPDAASQAATAKPKIPSVQLSGTYADLPEVGGDLATMLLAGAAKPKPFYPLIDKLEDLAEGESPVVLFDLTDSFGLNGAQLAEVARAIKKIRAAGKTCYAYLENTGSIQYQIAALCDEVVMADLGTIDIPSLALSVMFLKDAMDLLGVQMDVVRCGDFKGAVEPYLLSSMSDHLKRHYKAMLERLNNDFVTRIANGRGLTVAAVRKLQGERMFRADEAKAKGLVDRIVPWKGPEVALAVALGNDDFELRNALKASDRPKNVNFMQVFSQLLNPRKRDEDFAPNTLAVLHLSGAIVDGKKPAPGSIVSGPTVANIRKLIENDDIRGVVVRINSPGGSATASEAILQALSELSEAKPVAVSMGSVAASGGYYVTCFGRPIFAEATTITGSIGVFGMKPNLGPLMRRIGIHDELVALDESAAMASMTVRWTDEQKERVQSLVNQVYDVFVGHVADSRGLEESDVLAIAGGRVWSGEQARDRKLVDRIGGLEEALALVAKDAGLADGFEVEHLPRAMSLFETLASEMFEIKTLWPELGTKVLTRRVGLDRALRLVLDALENERPTAAWALMPETLTIR